MSAEPEKVLQEATPENKMEWVSLPVRERPWASVALVLIMVIAAWAAAMVMGNLWWGLTGLGLLFLSMWSYFLPVRFTMDETGIRKKSVFGEEVRRWHEVRSIASDRFGVLLSPFPKPSRLARFRGLSVQFSGNGKEVLEFIRARIGS